MDRRSFIRTMLKDNIKSVKESISEINKVRDDVTQTITEALEDIDEPGFFDSYEMSYSLTLAYPRDMFEQMADKEGIPHEGRETLEIVKDLHERGVI
ncbi:hypothetical protein [Limisalsivibrio acetivorans]|uniref:hypothetical protein n=1 Tax=Limisalsivibrio acetivorans TaxID=1304888 RepID=UPI0003B5EC61|nr:hypothetical protein [Limisalsivibrio acetivorans]